MKKRITSTAIMVIGIVCLSIALQIISSENFLDKTKKEIQKTQQTFEQNTYLQKIKNTAEASINKQLNDANVLSALTNRIGTKEAQEAFNAFKDLLVQLEVTLNQLEMIKTQAKKDENIKALLLSSIPPIEEYKKQITTQLIEMSKRYSELKTIFWENKK